VVVFGSIVYPVRKFLFLAELRNWLLSPLPGVNYLAFDIVGDLAFGEPFGMIEAAKDMALLPKKPEDVMQSYGTGVKTEAIEIPAVKILNGRGEYSMSMGVLPAWWRPLVRQIPWYRRGQADVKTLAGIAIMAVAKRLDSPTDRVDLLSKLKAGRDNEGNPMGREELTAEALTLLIAGSDTTSKYIPICIDLNQPFWPFACFSSTCAIIYHLAHNPHIQERLHRELDEQLGTEDETIATGDQVKRLPYLDACINEALRIHSTSALGLPRVVPEGGLTVLGQFFPEGTVLSVPSYSIHRDTTVWGEDVEAYRPERWFERDAATIQKTFNPFSLGPRYVKHRLMPSLDHVLTLPSHF
jgi:benzoate 4-monooxygenase